MMPRHRGIAQLVRPDVVLHCLPHAGSSATRYLKWRTALAPQVEVRPEEPAGRGGRLDEPPFDDVAAMADDLMTRLTDWDDGRAHALFGHSLGGLLAYELARRIVRAGRRPPVRVFISGCPAPRHHRAGGLHALPVADLLTALGRLGGVPDDPGGEPGLLAFLLPIIRADFRAYETYRHPWGDAPPLDIPLSILAAMDDPLAPVHDCRSWRDHFGGPADEFVLASGGHFFTESAGFEVAAHVGSTLGRHSRSADGRARS